MTIKLLVYRKSTHTDQYLHFSSHHPLQHKLSVIRTLLDRSTNIVTEEQDRKQEEHHIQTALTCCGYPEWSINKAKSQMATSKQKKVTRKLTRQHSDVNKTTVVIPYVQDLSEAVTRVTIVMVSPLPWDLSSHYVACWYIPKISPDRKMSANASTRYRVGIATKPILGRQAEHLEFDYRNTGKKFHNVIWGPHKKHQQITGHWTEQVSNHRSRHHSQPCHRLGPGQGRRQRKQQNGSVD